MHRTESFPLSTWHSFLEWGSSPNRCFEMRFKRELHFLFVVITADSPIGVKTAMTRVLDIIASSYPAEYNQILYM